MPLEQTPEASRFPDIDDRIAAARVKTWEAVERIAAAMQPGMRESEAIKVGQKILVEMGAKKFWHKCHVRFGKGTVRSFNDEYEDNILGANDIFYIDIGPIWAGIEGDAGATFTTGVVPHMQRCAADAKGVFDKVHGYWRNTNVSGKALYAFAASVAREYGWILNPSYVQGHRLSEFPHSFFTKANLAELDFTPREKRWVLEIQICDPQLNFGAFFEDVL